MPEAGGAVVEQTLQCRVRALRSEIQLLSLKLTELFEQFGQDCDSINGTLIVDTGKCLACLGAAKPFLSRLVGVARCSLRRRLRS